MPVDLIALVPFVLGFHPAESVVVLTFGSPHGAFHARVDLPHGRAERMRVVTTLRDAVTGNGATTAVVLVFSTDDAAARRISADLVPALLHVDVQVIDAIRADDGTGGASDRPTRFRTGSRVTLRPEHPSVHRGAGARGARGLRRPRVPGRLPPAGHDAGRCRRPHGAHPGGGPGSGRPAGPGRHPRALRESARWLLEEVSGFDEDRGTGARPCPATAARIGVLVALPDMRDVICTALRRPGAAGQVSGWRDLLVRMPGDLVPGSPPCSRSRLAAGEGALAWVAIDRCTANAPEGRTASAPAGRWPATSPIGCRRRTPPAAGDRSRAPRWRCCAAARGEPHALVSGHGRRGRAPGVHTHRPHPAPGEGAPQPRRLRPDAA